MNGKSIETVTAVGSCARNRNEFVCLRGGQQFIFSVRLILAVHQAQTLTFKVNRVRVDGNIQRTGILLHVILALLHTGIAACRTLVREIESPVRRFEVGLIIVRMDLECSHFTINSLEIGGGILYNQTCNQVGEVCVKSLYQAIDGIYALGERSDCSGVFRHVIAQCRQLFTYAAFCLQVFLDDTLDVSALQDFLVLQLVFQSTQARIQTIRNCLDLSIDDTGQRLLVVGYLLLEFAQRCSQIFDFLLQVGYFTLTGFLTHQLVQLLFQGTNLCGERSVLRSQFAREFFHLFA